MAAETQLLNALREQGKITEDQYKDLVRKVTIDMRSETDVLSELGNVSEDDIVQAKAKVFNIPYAELGGIQVTQDILTVIPEEIAKNYSMVAYERMGETIKVGLVDPKNFKAIEAAEFLAKDHGLKIEFSIITQTDFDSILKKYKVLGQEVEQVLGQAKEKFDEEAKEEAGGEDMESVLKSAPVSRIVSVIIKYAADAGASDIHIEPTSEGTKVRYRIDGILRVRTVLPSYIHSAIVSRIKVLANLKLDETRKPQDGRIKMMVDKSNIDLRVSTLPLVGQEKVVMRILDTSGVVLTLEQLGFRKQLVEKVQKTVKQAYGEFLVCGPTGAGKSTTLYSVLNMLNEEGVNIVTLEDPAEYFIPGVNQSQVNSEVGFTFASGLRSILRQDPDIIMVGEIRDNETAELAVHAALTGHIVFSTLHTNNAWGAFPRLMDMHVEPFLLGSTLKGVAAQRLVRRICPDCKETFDMPEKKRKEIEASLDQTPDIYKEHLDMNNLEFWRGKGCPQCNGSGYKGRTVIAEVIVVTEAMQKIINTGFKDEEVQAELEAQQAITMRHDGILKVVEGITTYEEVLRVMQT